MRVMQSPLWSHRLALDVDAVLFQTFSPPHYPVSLSQEGVPQGTVVLMKSLRPASLFPAPIGLAHVLCIAGILSVAFERFPPSSEEFKK